MAKMSSYQKMKAKYEAEINLLKSDIMDLTGDNEVSKRVTLMKYRLNNQLASIVFYGSPTNEPKNMRFEGILKAIQNG